MGSTEYSIGLGEGKLSSKVLRPPGGASSNIFGNPDEIKPHVRPKYDQQNSSNLNFCMNTVDPNIKVQQMKGEVVAAAQPEQSSPAPSTDRSATDAPAVSFGSPPAEVAQPKVEANLPSCHHHRSTALW